MCSMTRGGSGVPSQEGLPELLRRIRKDVGLSIKAAGPRLGVNYTYLSKIENGAVAPSAELLSRMAEVYNENPEELFRAAKRLPPDVLDWLEEHRDEAIAVLRSRFAK